MYILAFLLLMCSIIKLLLLGTVTWGDIKSLNFNQPVSSLKYGLLIILAETILELSCSIFILI